MTTPALDDSVYESPRRRPRASRAAALSLPLLAAALTTLSALALPMPASAQSFDTTVLDAREAFRKRDRVRLAQLRAQSAAEKNPLALWVEYWELTHRIGEIHPAEFTAFAERWSGSYVEDRMRNDWLLELGRRRDWNNVAAEFPRFRMNDDREATCYWLVTEQLAGRDVKEAGLAAWLAQKDADDGCAVLAATLHAAKALSTADVWKKVRLSVEAGKPKAARQAAALVSDGVAAAVGDLLESPAIFLAKKASTATRNDAELAALALVRMAQSDNDTAAALLADRWERALPAELASWTWASIGRQTAMKLQPAAADQFLRAARLLTRTGREIELSDDTLAWKVRAALRADGGRARWQQVIQAVNAMSPGEQKDPAWTYWKARGLKAIAKDSQESESLLATSRELFTALASQLNFYGALAAEELGQPQALPPRAAPITQAEKDAVTANPGLVRGLVLVSIGLRGEGVREWNYTIRGMSDRELLAAAQYACDREVWDRCINTSDKTKDEIALEQRFPMPLLKDVSARAGEIGLDPAFVYGLIRQESRFIMDARSHVG
ncbi:MAG TPA: lytic transglycosylase domain-containing protein, partial [Caldimonas sp.]